MASKLHQLLAVDDDLRTKSKLILSETVTTFSKKADHFDGLMKIYVSNEEGGEEIVPEFKEIVTTVGEKLSYALKDVARAVDTKTTINETNSSGKASAELTANGVNFGTFSATSLLELEKFMTHVRTVYREIPTLDPTRVWEKRTTEANDVYYSQEEVKFRTNKVQAPLTLAPATDKHPAQVQMITKDVQVGKYKTTYKSGRITPSEKSILLGRIDEIILAIKKARALANQAEVTPVTVADKIFASVNQGIF